MLGIGTFVWCGLVVVMAVASDTPHSAVSFFPQVPSCACSPASASCARSWPSARGGRIAVAVVALVLAVPMMLRSVGIEDVVDQVRNRGELSIC